MEEYIQVGIDNGLIYLKGKIFEMGGSLLKSFFIFVAESSDVVCPIVCLLALAFYIGGSKKAGRIVSGSFVFYFITCTLRRFIK